METPSIFLSISTVFLFWLCFYALKIKSKSRKLPPGPYPLPILGNIVQLVGIFHASLAQLSKVHGPLMTIRIGSKVTVVVSSSEIAKKLLPRNDHQFLQRPVPDAATAADHDKLSVVWLPALAKWRSLRKLSKERIFSSERLNASQELRQEKAQELSDYLRKCCKNEEVVNVCEVAFTASLNLLSQTIFSVDFADYGSISSHEMKEIVTEVMQTVAAPNVADILPVLKALDPQGIRRKVKAPLVKLLHSFDGLIARRLHERQESSNYSRRDDFFETLLDLTEESEAEWSHQDIKHLIVDLILAGTETNSNTVEWAMAELLKSPEKLRKARNEIKEVLGGNTFVQESDISRLPYLQAIVKETLRLHPAATILVRQPEHNIEIEQYIVPKKAQIFVNIWAIGRDPGQWPDPDAFVPERFLGKDIDMKGQHFELLPFGTGRRMCLGIVLADRMLHLVLAAFLHGFDWKLEDGMIPEEIDMNERFGIVVQKALPLKAIPFLDFNVLNP